MRVFSIGINSVLSSAGDSLKWNMLFPLGATKFRADFGSITFDEKLLGTMVENFKRRQSEYSELNGAPDGFGLPVTFTHVGPSLPENSKRVEDLRAGGWLEDLELRDDGLWGLTRWTKEGQTRVLNDEFRYLSPEFDTIYFDPNTGRDQGPTLFGAALLTDPFLYEMPRVAATRETAPKTLLARGTVMDKAKLCALLGLPETATEADIEAAIVSLKGAPIPAAAAAPVPAVVAMADMERTRIELAHAMEERKVLASQLDAVNADRKLLADKLSSLEKKQQDAEVKSLCDSLLAEGKILPIQVESTKLFAQKLGVQHVADHYAKAPKIVLTGEVGISSADPAGANRDADRKRLFAEADKIQREQKVKSEAALQMARAANPQLSASVFGR